MEPLVTCLCLTTPRRREWLPRAIECFRLQTFVNRELLIVGDGPDLSDLIPSDDPRIRQLWYSDQVDDWTMGNVIGVKRNMGCRHAAGEIICHWDDDDYSAPGRIEDQVRMLETSGLAVTGYRSMKFTDGKQWWQYTGVGEYVIGTSLCYQRSWARQYPFPPRQRNEDNEFVSLAARCGQLAVVESARDLMYARVHSGNEVPKIMTDVRWQRIDAPTAA